MSPESHGVWYSYAIIRIVPRVERGEFINAGVILFAPTSGPLLVRAEIDRERLRALDRDVNLEMVERHVRALCAVADGTPDGGPPSEWPPAERFHWLTAPRSTIIQTSPVHSGVATDLEAELDELYQRYVQPDGSMDEPGSKET